MRLYGKKFLKLRMGRETDRRVESRDAILWDIVNLDERTCRIKVQGSDELILAHFAKNQSHSPTWLVRGAAVSIRHTGGLRGRIEVIGDGMYIPSTAGEAPATAMDDGVLTGMTVLQTSTPSTSVWVNPGTYRIGGITYVFGGDATELLMGSGSPMIMGDGTILGDNGTRGRVTFALDVSSGNYRYDIITVDISGVLHVVKGTQATTSPVMPEAPGGQVKVGHVLLWYGVTAISQFMINMLWTEPHLTSCYDERTYEILTNMGGQTPIEGLVWWDNLNSNCERYDPGEEPPGHQYRVDEGILYVYLIDQYNHVWYGLSTVTISIRQPGEGNSPMTGELDGGTGTTQQRSQTSTAGVFTFRLTRPSDRQVPVSIEGLGIALLALDVQATSGAYSTRTSLTVLYSDPCSWGGYSW